MNTKKSIAQAYDRAADDYAVALWNELDNKPFDRIILNWFAAQMPPNEAILEIGSGPGEVSGYLASLGAKCLGTDISEQMIKNARKYFPQAQFEVQDFFHLRYENLSFSRVVGFYAIVNLMLEEIKLMLLEIKRVLKNDGIFLFSFHIYEGEDKVEVKKFFNHEANELTFYYFKVDEIKEIVENLGYQIVDILIRYPYKDVEHQSKRAYFIVKKPGENKVGTVRHLHHST